MKFFTKILSAILLMFSSTIFADEYCFKVWTKSGEQISFPISEKPKITHNNDNFIVSSTSTSVEYAAADVKKFTLEPVDPDGIETIKPLNSNICQFDNTLMLSGFRTGSIVKIITLNGQSLITETINNDGTLSIDLSSLNKGIYIVSTECITCKFIKR